MIKDILKGMALSAAMLLTMFAIMNVEHSTTPVQKVGGAAQRLSYSTATASTTLVTTSPTLLIATSTSPDTLGYAEFGNQSSVTIYVCAFTALCSVTNGQEVVSHGTMRIQDANPYQGAVYAVTASGTATTSIYVMK